MKTNMRKMKKSNLEAGTGNHLSSREGRKAQNRKIYSNRGVLLQILPEHPQFVKRIWGRRITYDFSLPTGMR